jgi:WD40 repeat protein
VEQLIGRLGESRFLAVVGPSGSGKSSAVKAGLIPALRAKALPGSEKWFVTEMVPGTHPLEELELALWPVAVDPPPSLVAPMERDTRGMLRTIRRILPDEQDAQLLLVIDQFEELFTLVEDEERREFFIDSLLAALRAPRSPLRVVVTLRADFYDRPLQYETLGRLLKENTEIVLPLTAEELSWAVREPARRMGVRLESGLAEVIVSDVAEQPGALPLLQYAMTELFERRQNGRMRRAAYEDIGGVLGALGRRAEEIYGELDPAGQAAARQIFLRLVTLGEGVEDTRRRVLRSELESFQTPEVSEPTEVSSGVIYRFGAARLLTFDHDPATRRPTVEVAHEALLREWGRMRGWLDESRYDVRLQRALATAAAEWAGAGQDPGFLLRDARLDQFAGWAADSSVALTGEENAYLRASVSAREARLAVEEARLERELETAKKLVETERARAEEQTRATGRLRQRAILLAGALVVAGILAITAFSFAQRANRSADEALTAQADAENEASQKATAEADALDQKATAEANAVAAVSAQATAEAESVVRATAEVQAIQERESAETQFRLARSRELSGLANSRQEIDPEQSLLLAMEAMSTSYTVEAESVLHRAILSSRVRQRFDTGQRGALINVVAISPDGAFVAAESGPSAADGSNSLVSVWSTATGQLLFQIPVRGIDVNYDYDPTLSFSPDGRRLATLNPGETTTFAFWDVPSGVEASTLELPLSGATLSNYALSPDWSQVAIGYTDGSAVVWDVATGEQLYSLTGHNGRLGLTYSRDGRRLASVDGQIAKVWDAASGQELVTVNHGYSDASLYQALSPDGKLLALVDEEEAGIWDLAASTSEGQSAVLLSTLSGHDNLIFDISFNSDGTQIATTSRDGTARIWDPFTGDQQLLLAHGSNNANSVAFNRSGSQLFTGNWDGSVAAWNITATGEEELNTLPVSSSANTIALSPDETRLAVAGADGAASVWDVNSREVVLTLVGHTERILNIRYSPDGRHIATASLDGTAIIWDATTGEPLSTLDRHGEGLVGGFFTGVLDVAFSPDGRLLATAGADKTARIWDVESGEEMLVIDYPTGLTRVVFSPDGSLLATASDEPEATVVLWDVATGQALVTLPRSHADRVWGVAFSPDGTLLATSGGDATAKVWQFDTTNGSADLLATLAGHSGTVGQVTFAPAGRSLITSSCCELKMWDLSPLLAPSLDNPDTPQTPIERFSLPGSAIGNAIITADGQALIYKVQSGDQQVARFVTLSVDELMALGEERLTRTWTAEECRQYRIDSCPAVPVSSQ